MKSETVKNNKIWLKRDRVPRKYWENDKHVKEALRWLFEEKLDIFHNNNIITVKNFKDNNLLSLLITYFDSSPYKAINYMYPDVSRKI